MADGEERDTAPSTGNVVERLTRWADGVQSRRVVLGFPYAVVKKYGDDQGGRHAALLTYYGFLSLFPLLLLVVAILNLLLVNDPSLQEELVDAVVPEDLQPTVESALGTLPDSGVPLVVAIVGLVLSGLGVVNSAYETLNQLAGVRFRERLGLVPRTLRTLAALLVLVVGALGVGAQSVVVGAVPALSALSRAALFVGGVVLTALVVWGLVALLVPVRVRFSSVWPGLLAAGVVVSTLLTFGAVLLPGFVARSGPVYGSFATIVGLFALLALVFQGVVIAGETAVVRRRRLWPRALDSSRPLDADRRALTALARQQERIPPQRITTRFDATPEGRV
jgi:YihY family inner membrane protein